MGKKRSRHGKDKIIPHRPNAKNVLFIAQNLNRRY